MNPEIVKLREIIFNAKNDLKVIQSLCDHPPGHLFYKACGNSGGWDYDASYWYEWKCTYCDNKWTTPQEYKYIQEHPHAKKFESVTINKW
jgi:hypothetical protein